MSQLLSSAQTGSHPLHSSAFRWLWVGQAISTFGNRFTTIAIPLFIYQLTGSSMQLGAAFVTQVVAALLFGLLAGAYTDRWNRRRTMLAADIIRAALIMLLPLSLLIDLPLTWRIAIIYFLSFCVAAVGQFFTPAKISLIPKTIGDDQLVVANSLDQGTTNFMEFIGYSVAGILIYATSVSVAFLVDAATFVASALCIYMIRVREKGDDEKAGSDSAEFTQIINSIKAGLARLWQVPSLRWLLFISLLAPIAIGAVQPLTVIFVQSTLGLSEVSYGFWQATIAIGIAVGVIAVGRFAADIKRTHLVSVGVLGFGLFHTLAIAVPLWLQANIQLSENNMLLAALPFVALLSACNGSIFLGIRTMIQENTPNEMIGRVFSAIMVVSSMAIALGQMATGLADLFSAATMLIFWSVFMFLIGLVAIVSSAKLADNTQSAQLEVGRDNN